ncbi:MAG: fold metallo-hydrolase [Frankiales bacterium]|nr:fold metallo-hydrolase [Frankiales bacterium]
MTSASTRRTLVLGGARSGKSQWAEWELNDAGSVDYLATAAGRDDADWADRLALHRERRPRHWRTVESVAVARLLRDADRPLLIDDLGNWVARTIDEVGEWVGPLTRFRQASDELEAAWADFGGTALLVSNEVGSGIHPETRAGRVFQDEMGRLNARLARHADEVVLLVAGIPTWIKPRTPRPSEPHDRTGDKP